MKIQFRNLHFSYEKDREILAGIDLDMPAGAFISLVGESGCGKSTIAGILAGRNRGFSGSVTVNGTALEAVSYTHLDVYKRQENGSYGAKTSGTCK